MIEDSKPADQDYASDAADEAAALGSDTAPAFSIGDLARQLDITTRTIRFYEAKGLIRPARVSGARVYTRRDRARMLLILRGKRLGYALDEIREFLDLYDADPTQVTQLTHLLSKVDARMAELETKKAALEESLTDLRQVRDETLRRLEVRNAAE